MNGALPNWRVNKCYSQIGPRSSTCAFSYHLSFSVKEVLVDQSKPVIATRIPSASWLFCIPQLSKRRMKGYFMSFLVGLCVKTQSVLKCVQCICKLVFFLPLFFSQVTILHTLHIIILIVYICIYTYINIYVCVCIV